MDFIRDRGGIVAAAAAIGDQNLEDEAMDEEEPEQVDEGVDEQQLLTAEGQQGMPTVCRQGPGSQRPAGVGAGRDPQEFMWPGDVVECHVEGIGTLRNPIVAI